jgi:hypothetical protein
VIVLLMLMQALPAQNFLRVDTPGGMVHQRDSAAFQVSFDQQVSRGIDEVAPPSMDRTCRVARTAWRSG